MAPDEFEAGSKFQAVRWGDDPVADKRARRVAVHRAKGGRATLEELLGIYERITVRN